MTLEEAFTEVKLEVGHFRIFGCLVYSHVPKDKRERLESTAEKQIFVGYSEVSKACQIYIPSLRKVVARQDVKFEEDKALRRSHGSDAEAMEQEALKAEVTPALATTGGQSYDDEKEEE